MVILYYLKQPHWSDDILWINVIGKMILAISLVRLYYLKQSYWSDDIIWSNLIGQMILSEAISLVRWYYMKQSHWSDYIIWSNLIGQMISSEAISIVRWYYLKQSHWSLIIWSNFIGQMMLYEAISLIRWYFLKQFSHSQMAHQDMGPRLFHVIPGKYSLFVVHIYVLCGFSSQKICCAENVSMARQHIDGLVQDCSNSIVNALELLQSCIKPLTSWSSRKQKDKTTSCSCSAVDVTWLFDGVSFHQAQHCLHLPADMKAWDMQGMQNTDAMYIHSE